VRGGQTYRVISPAARGLVRPALAEALETVFERFAREHGFTPEKPLEISLSRGFKAGSHGHGEGRAADIATVDGKELLAWKQAWDRTITASEKPSDRQQQAGVIAARPARNLGYRLYKALQEHGGWRVNQEGWRPYRGVMQLFGPWTATDGPGRRYRSRTRISMSDSAWLISSGCSRCIRTTFMWRDSLPGYEGGGSRCTYRHAKD
jgi:hypothetical protein